MYPEKTHKSLEALQWLNTYRIFIFLAGILIPLFGHMYRITDPTAYEPMILRYILCVICFAVLVLSYTSEFFKIHLDKAFYLITLLMFIWLPYLLFVNSLLLNYVLGYTMAFSAVMVAYRSNKALLLFVLYVFGITIFISLNTPVPDTSPLIFIGSVGTIGIALYFAVMGRNLLQNNMSQREERFRMLIENALDIIYLIDKEGKFKYLSPAVERVTGYSTDELLYKDSVDFLHPDDLDETREFLKKVYKTEGGIFKRSQKLRHKNGHYIYLEGEICNLLHNPNVNALVGNFHDISDKLKKEEELEISNRRYELVSRASGEAIWDWNMENDELYWSEAYTVLFGHTPNSTRGINNWAEHVHPEDKDRVVETLNKIVETEDAEFWQQEYRYIKKSGQTAYVLDRGYITRNCNNKPIRMTGSMRDISAAKIAEDEKAKISRDLSRQNQALAQFAYIISHNLRAPVANIMGILTLMRDNHPDKEMTESLQKGLFVSAEKMDQVIRDLNNILHAKYEINQTLRHIKLDDLIQEIQQAISDRVMQNNIQFHADFSNAQELLSVQTVLFNVLYELIYNSIKFRKTAIPLKIELESTRTDKSVLIRVKDNGSGLDMERYHDQVFGLYKRFHLDVEGKGMGLFMAKTQVEILGGNIRMNSKPAIGTEVEIEFFDQV